MNDILFGNNNSKSVRQLSKRYFKKNKVRNAAAILAIFLTAFLFTSVTSLAFNLMSSLQLSMQMQKGSKADGTLGYMTEEQYEQLVNSDFIEQAGHRRIVAYASNASNHSIEINYADSVQQELTFCVPTHGTAPEKTNEIATSDLALKALGVEPEIGAAVPLEFEVRGKTYHYDMVVSGWWEASNDSISLAIVSEQFVEENPDIFQNTYAEDREYAGMTYSEVVLKDKTNVQEQLENFVYSIGGSPEMGTDNFILCSANQVTTGLVDPTTIVFVVVFILLFVVCGYLLIYNIFDISVMQDVRQYGLLRTIGASSRQIKSIVNRQAVWLTLIGLPIGLIAGFFAGWMMFPFAMEIFNYSVSATQVSTSPLVVVIAALFTILTVFISTRKPAKKAARVSPLEAIRYTEQDSYKKQAVRRTGGAKLSHMAFSNLGRNKRRSVFIVISMLLCVVLFNSIFVVTQSMDEEKWITRMTKTDFTLYSSTTLNTMKGFRYHEDGLPQVAVDMICEQPGVEDGRYLYRNTMDDRDVLVDYGFEGLAWTDAYESDYNEAFEKSYDGYIVTTASATEDRCYGNVMGASENFWDDLQIFDGEQDIEVLKQKLATGEYAVIGCLMDRLTGEPDSSPLDDLLQVGDSISFYKDGELVKTCTILAKATVLMNEMESSGNTGILYTGGEAPFVYLPDTVFKQIYDSPTLLSYGFNVEEPMQPQMEEFLSSYVENTPSVGYNSTGVLKEQMASLRSMVLIVGGLIGIIFAIAGLINFINMMITNIITRRHEFATMQSIGMTSRQLRRMMVYEGIYYAAGADVIGVLISAVLAVTVLKSVLNSPSMWFFTLHVTLVPALVICVLYLILAAVIPVIVLHFFNKGTVVERLRTSE